MDGAFYLDTREPFLGIADQGSAVLSSTFKALYTASAFPSLGGQYFARPGKKLWIHLTGKMTTGATPGNGQLGVYYGTGADANGVQLAISKAFALTANVTGSSWFADIFVTCRTTGNAGTLFCVGEINFSIGLVASNLQPIPLPEGNAAASAACDLTAALIISVNFLRSGSTAETMTVQDGFVVAMN